MNRPTKRLFTRAERRAALVDGRLIAWRARRSRTRDASRRVITRAFVLTGLIGLTGLLMTGLLASFTPFWVVPMVLAALIGPRVAQDFQTISQEKHP